MIWIYGLVDPNTNRVRYVGQSDDPRHRLSNHEAAGSSGMRYWLDGLKVGGQRAVIVIFDFTEIQEDADRKEKEWIDRFTTQGLLINQQFNRTAKRPKPEVVLTRSGQLPRGSMNRGAAMLGAAMAKADMNQSALAALLGITQPSVSGLLKGLSRPRLPNAAALQKLFGIPLDAWVEPVDDAGTSAAPPAPPAAEPAAQ